MKRIYLKQLAALLCVCVFSFANADVYNVSNISDSGVGSLRDAMEQANVRVGKDTVRFAIPGAGPHTIQPLTVLPYINDSLFIDGFSQSGQNIYSIELDGTLSGGNGLHFWDFISTTKPHASKVEGLVIQKFGTGIFLSSGALQNILITKCKIQNGGQGIAMVGSANCTLSYNEIMNNSSFGVYAGNPEYCNIIYNTVSNNLNDGFFLTGSSLKNNIEGNNFFGNSQNGITILSGAKLNSIRSNNIYSNSKHGIYSNGPSDSCYFENNLIGMDSSWTDKGNLEYGIRIENAGHTNTFLKNNSIGFCKTGGIYIQGTETKIIGNYIGTNPLNADLGNDGPGLYIYYGSSKVNVGDGSAAGQNILAYNSGDGILVANSSTSANAFSRNLIYNNDIKAISLGITGASTWGNDSKATPYITKKTYSNGQLTLTVQAETGDVKAELYKSSSGLTDAVQFVSNTPVGLGNGMFSFTFSWPNNTDYFTVSSTDAAGSSSELGYELARTLVVTNVNDNGIGSLRHAMETANLIDDTSRITFNIPGTPPFIIQPLTYLPYIKYSTIIDASSFNKEVIIDGSSLSSTNCFNMPSASHSGIVEIRKLKIQKFNTAIASTNFRTYKFEDLDLFNNSNGPFIITGGGDSLIINNCRIFYNGSSINLGYGLLSTTIVIISNCTISGNIGAGIALGQGTIKKAIVKNNILNNNTFWGINLSWIMDSVYVFNNQIFDNEYGGIGINRGGAVHMKGNTIGLDKSTNVIKSNIGPGIALDFTGAKITIDSNIIVGNTKSGIQASRYSNLFVSRNYIGTIASSEDYGNGEDGILLDGGGIIDDNVIGNNGLYGINTRYATIINNYIGVSKDYKDIGNTKSGLRNSLGTGEPNIINNFIGFNHEHGVEISSAGSTYMVNNYVGVFQNKAFGNKKWGVSGLYSNILIGNSFAHNDSGAVHVPFQGGKLSRNLFLGSSPKAIWLNNGTGNLNKQPATITTSANTPSSLTLSGTGVDGDTVEIFYSSSAPEIASQYLGYAKVVGGTWQLVIPSGTGYNPLSDNYYVNTATTAANNTSQLSTPFKVDVNLCAIPNLNTLTPLVGFCKDDSIHLDAGANNVLYRWYTNNTLIGNTQQIWLKESGIYRIEGEDANGCVSRDTVRAIENALPLTADFLMPSEAGKGDKVVVVDISFTQPDSLIWDFGIAQVTQDNRSYILVFPDTGYYQVQVTSYLGLCSKSARHYIHIGEESKASPDGMVYPYVIKEVTLEPNPNNGQFTLRAELVSEANITVEVLNFMGMLVQKTSSTGKSFTHTLNYDLSHLTAGNYIIRVISGTESKVLRMLKE